MSKNNNTNPDNQPNQTPNGSDRQANKPDERTFEAGYQKLPLKFRPKAGRTQRDPIDYDSHPYPSMKQFAEFLALRFNTPRTRHSYYRQIRLVHEFSACDPGFITEELYRNYILHVKIKKLWKPKTIRQAAAAARLFSFGSGENIIKYLGAYVCRTAIGDSRILSISDTHVSFRWKDRAHGDAQRVETLEGAEFVKRYLRHVLPRGMRAVRYFGFCHPAAKIKRERIAFHTGRPLLIGALPVPPVKPPHVVACPCCGEPMIKLLRLRPEWSAKPAKASMAKPSRAPPPMKRSCA